MKLALFLCSLIFIRSSFALETDNYIVWKKNLKSSEKILNRYFLDNIEDVIKNNQNISCEKITKKIFLKFKSRFVHDNPVENFLMDHLTEDYIYPKTIHYIEESIYQNPFLPHVPYFGLAPNIQVNGYYFGTDKLSHFASVGYIYFSKNYLRKAIDYGIQDEKTLHGYWASGVFSYADLEANYQGFLFYKNICSDPDSMLEKVNKNWVIKNKPQIKKYINGYWDESFYPSYRVEKNWTKVSPIIRKKYCVLQNPRLKYYQKTSAKSPSMIYLERVEQLPRPQKICE